MYLPEQHLRPIQPHGNIPAVQISHHYVRLCIPNCGTGSLHSVPSACDLPVVGRDMGYLRTQTENPKLPVIYFNKRCSACKLQSLQYSQNIIIFHNRLYILPY